MASTLKKKRAPKKQVIDLDAKLSRGSLKPKNPEAHENVKYQRAEAQNPSADDNEQAPCESW